MKTAEILELTGFGPVALRAHARALPIQTAIVERSPTLWSIADVTALLILRHLVDRKVDERTARAIVAETMPNLDHLVATGGNMWAFVWPDQTSSTGSTWHTTSDSEEGLQLILEREDCSRFSIHSLIKAALVEIARATIGDRPR